jgi:protein-disulfide isomerase
MLRVLLVTALIVSGVLSLTAVARPLFQLGQKTYHFTDLPAKYRLQLYEADAQAYQLKEKIIDDVLLDLHFQMQAKTSRKTPEQLRDEALAVAEPTEKELKQFYQSNRRKIPYPFEQIRSELVKFVQNQKRESRREQLLSKIKMDQGLVLKLVKPQRPRIDIEVNDFFSRGKADSPVQLVEFADYKCPYCARAAEVIDKLYAAYGDKVRFVFIDFPVLGNLSHELAEAAYCAGQQGKFWPFHKQVFAQQESVTETSITTFAKQFKLDMDAFEACLESEAAEDYVAAGKQEGERIGLSGTPTLFVNGDKISAPLDYERLADILAKSLKKPK